MYCDIDISEWTKHRPCIGFFFTNIKLSGRFLASVDGANRWIVGLRFSEKNSKEDFTDEYCINLIDDNPNIIHLGCMAHARRPFAELVKLAKQTGKSHQAIAYFQKLYAIEKQARDGHLTPEQRFDLRLEKATPILEEAKKWLDQSLKHAMPQPLSNGLLYLQKRWQELNNYLIDGMLEIDNNGAENQIRPFALGRKNQPIEYNKRQKCIK